MNIKLFKKLIKEAVTEAIYEELPELIEEALVKHNKKSQLTENKTMSFTSNSIPLAGDVRNQLASKMGAQFGFNQPQQASSLTELKVIDNVDENTGEKVNPFLAFLADSANNMTPQERAGLKRLD
jgi:hypothetical protein